ncbi:response regulator [Nocardioides cavernae]|uniref:Response regulator n=1 Tax=Nocardioides cavernae TaxID=1921566 RepID=A0ABR8N8S2_9ACTN|nr:response regulator [Nocardioides cavernae]MBD3924551.1 response regulator [Nocardioides cavernae]MBM7510500.1 CheY-like chemotaxis protein [Nocardioides cavernae]
MALRSLVADDEPDIRDFIGHVLERAGHVVTTAGDGAEVLAHTATESFDLVVVDHHMPRMTGLAVADELRRTSPSTKVLIMSGDLDVGDEHRHFLPKPFNRGEFLAAVDNLLALPGVGGAELWS